MAKTRTRRKPRTGASGEEGEQPQAGPTGAEQEGGVHRGDNRQWQQECQGRSENTELAGRHGQERPRQHKPDTGLGLKRKGGERHARTGAFGGV